MPHTGQQLSHYVGNYVTVNDPVKSEMFTVNAFSNVNAVLAHCTLLVLENSPQCSLHST